MTVPRIVKAYVDTPHGQIHYRHVSGEGTPLALYHRAPSSSASFETMMELMAGDRPLYAFDIPGFGESFAPPGTPTAADYAQWLLAALDGLNLQRVHTFAHHTGTHFSTELAARHPARVVSLMLNGIAYLTPQERADYAKTVQAPAQPDGEGAYMTGAFKLIAGLMPHFEPDLYHAEMIGNMQSHWSRHKSFAAIWGQDYPAVLKKVTCPILATCAENEHWRFCFERVFADRPDAKRMILGPARFYTPELDAPATVAAIRAFIREVEGV